MINCMENYNLNEEDIKKIRKFQEILNKGYYANGKEVTDVYNRVLNKNVQVTGCGPCLRGRATELVRFLDAYEKEQCKISGVTNDFKDENNVPVEASDSDLVIEPITMKVKENKPLKTKPGRSKKK